MTDTDAVPEPPGHGWADALAAAFVVFQGGQVGWEVVRRVQQGGGSGGAWAFAGGAAALLSVAAFVGLMYHRRWGWAAAMAACAGLAASWAVRLARTPHPWYAALLAGSVAVLAYLWWTRAVYDGTPRHPHDDVPHGEPRPDGAAVAAVLHAAGRALAEAGGPSGLPPGTLADIAASHGVTLADLGVGAEVLYRRYLDSYAADGALTPDERFELDALRGLLALDDDAVARIHDGDSSLADAPSADADSSPPAPDAAATDAPRDEASAIPSRSSSSHRSEEDADGRDREMGDAGAAVARMDDGGTVDSADTDRRTDAGGVEATPDSRDGHRLVDADDDGAPADSSDANRQADSVDANRQADADRPADTGDVGRAADREDADAPVVGLSADEQRELRALSRRAAVPVDGEMAPRELLARLRAYRDALLMPLASVAFDGALEPGEHVVAVRQVAVHRPAGRAPRTEDARGAVMDARSIVRWDRDAVLPSDRYQHAGGCRMVLTDRRILLVNAAGQQSPLPLERLRRAVPHADGLEVVPTGGPPLFLAFTDGVPDLAARLARVLRDRARGAR